MDGFAEVPTYHEAKLKIIKHNLLTVITWSNGTTENWFLVPLTSLFYMNGGTNQKSTPPLYQIGGAPL